MAGKPEDERVYTMAQAQAQNLKMVVLAVSLAIGFVAKTEVIEQRWSSFRVSSTDVVSVIDAAAPVEVIRLEAGGKV
ncbi:MAG: hypothetical protein ACU0A6_04260 [Shimia sp.]|uniref:hypothetical protein n=1 Tax=Shimia sp. TaxID=1954381 RepID=UPI004057F324